MKKIEVDNLALLEAGSLSGAIDGACAAVGIGGSLGWIVMGPTAWVVVGVGCAVNGFAGSQGWW